jgi:serine/threonine-protein kinase
VQRGDAVDIGKASDRPSCGVLAARRKTMGRSGVGIYWRPYRVSNDSRREARTVSTEALPVVPGDIVAGKYRIERVLGRGGMGFVLEATHLQLDQKVALKFLLPEVAANPEVVGRFVREARAAVKIQSEHVARVLDVGTLDSGAPFMVMEYLRGADLSRLVEDQGPLPVRDAVGYVLQTCEAIAEAHALGVVHRDLKPANLFLAERQSGQPIVKVLDFGISKAPMSVHDAALTKPTAMMGSPSYMSPEQMVAAETVDVRTDVWALGVVLYELVTGKVPFVADTMPELVGAVLQRTPEPIAVSRSDVPSELQAVVDRCLSKERDGRYPNVAELAAALAPLGPPRSEQSLERILHVLGLPAGSVRHPVRIAPAATAMRHRETFSPTFHGVQGTRARAWWWMPIVAMVAAGATVAVIALGRARSESPAHVEAAVAPPPSPLPNTATTPEPTAEAPPVREAQPTVLPSPRPVSPDELASSAVPVAPTNRAPRTDKPSRPAAVPASASAAVPGPASTAAPGNDCHIVSYFDADGNKHFKKECR